MSKEKTTEQVEAELLDDEVKPNEDLSDTEEVVEPEELDPETLLALALKENADQKDKMLRAVAEFENIKKRMERDRQAFVKYSGEHIFKELLPVVDNLTRALEHGVAEKGEEKKTLAALVEGVQLTLKSLQSGLEKFEVKAIDSVGKEFDPTHQEALTMAESDSIPKNHVINEFEKGYMFKDRLLRAAKVIVSSGAAGE